MGEFVCRVADANGRVYSHVEAAGTQAEARQKLADRGSMSIRSRAATACSAVFSSKERPASRRLGFPDPQPTVQYSHQSWIADSAGSGSSWPNGPSSPKLRPVVSQIRDRVREGKSLSEAVNEAGVFSKVISTAILAGEKSGNLPGVLDYYIAYQRVSTGVRKKILATLVYPVLLMTVAILVVTYLVTVVIPKFALLYHDMNVELPTATRYLIAITVDYRRTFSE